MDNFLANFAVNTNDLLLVQQETQEWHTCTVTKSHRGTSKEMVHATPHTKYHC